MPTWGAIADDVTGATDLANNFVARGMTVTVLLGTAALTQEMAEELTASSVHAVVIALKSRTAPVDDAISDSRAALRFLERIAVTRCYLKYCSTFDSTTEGNIGPVVDMVLAELGEPLTVAVPSFPATGRTLYQGHLFVGDRLLSESSMRTHPLTPMTDPDIVRHLQAQSTSRVVLIPLQTVRAGEGAIRARLSAHADRGVRTIAVVDAVDEDDLRAIAAATRELRVVTGASGLALGLPEEGASIVPRRIEIVPGRRVILSGSASARTREQVEEGKRVHPWRRLSPAGAMKRPADELRAVLEWAERVWQADPDTIPLVFATDAETEPVSLDAASDAMERLLAAIASGMVGLGARSLIVAGGETSGRVGERLGIRALRLGPQIDPGVAWSLAVTADGTRVNVAFKSGNFGGPDLFLRAWSALGEEEATE